MDVGLFVSLQDLSFTDKVSQPGINVSKPKSVPLTSKVDEVCRPTPPPLQEDGDNPSFLQKGGEGAIMIGFPSSMKDGPLINSLIDVGPMANCMESFLPDDDLISKVQKVVFDHNITLNSDAMDKIVDAIDQDLVNLNSSLVIPPTRNPFYIPSDKIQDVEVTLGLSGEGVGNVGLDPMIKKPLLQFPLSPTLPSPSPAKRGRKPKTFYTQLEIDVGIQSTLLSPKLGSGKKKLKFSPPFTRSVASKHCLKSELENVDLAIEKRGEDASPQGK